MSATHHKASLLALVASMSLPVAAFAHAGQHHPGPVHAHPAAAPAAASSASAQAIPQVSVRDCWVRAMPANLPSAGYFVVENQREQAVRLTGIETPAFRTTMLHETVKKDGMARMQHTSDVTVPAKGSLEFKPGGYHAMLEQPAGKLVVGERIDVRFLFGADGYVDAQCLLQAPATVGQQTHQH